MKRAALGLTVSAWLWILGACPALGADSLVGNLTFTGSIKAGLTNPGTITGSGGPLTLTAGSNGSKITLGAGVSSIATFYTTTVGGTSTPAMAFGAVQEAHLYGSVILHNNGETLKFIDPAGPTYDMGIYSTLTPGMLRIGLWAPEVPAIDINCILGTSTFRSTILPYLDNAKDLASSSLRFRDFYFSRNLIGPAWQPSGDATGAIQIQKQADSSVVVDVDTLNGRLGVNVAAPLTALHVVPINGTIFNEGIRVGRGSAPTTQYSLLNYFGGGMNLLAVNTGGGAEIDFLVSQNGTTTTQVASILAAGFGVQATTEATIGGAGSGVFSGGLYAAKKIISGTAVLDGSANTTLTGGAGNMTLIAGTGNSRTLTLQTTTSGGTATNAIVIGDAQTVTSYKTLATEGDGLLATRKVGRITAQTGAATICTLTTPAADASYRVSANILVTSAVAVSTSINVDYTDESNTARTMIMPLTGLAGTFVAGGLAIAAQPYESPAIHIRTKASSTITVSVAAGTFTSVTYNAEAAISQIQ